MLIQALARSAAIFLALLVSPPAFAETDADLGAKIAAQGTPKGVAPCMSCHGPDGAGMAPAAYPRIAGLNAEYMAKQLKDFQSGRRGNPVMMPMAKNLTDAEIDAGRLAESAPLWAAWVAYPAYRAKNKKVNTYIERIQGCFTYSMNAQGSAAGAPPSADSDTIVSLIAYSYWLAKGAPTGDETMPGRDYPRLRAPQRRDSTRNGGRPSTPPGAPFATARTEPA